jgi:hypothetical protein
LVKTGAGFFSGMYVLLRNISTQKKQGLINNQQRSPAGVNAYIWLAGMSQGISAGTREGAK